MRDEKELASGYAYDPNLGAAYHFEHFPIGEAHDLEQYAASSIYVIETINGTFADKKQSLVHRNKYFAWSLTDAIALAAHMQIGFAEIAEVIIDIRPATDDEAEIASKAMNYFLDKMPAAISDDTQLPDHGS